MSTETDSHMTTNGNTTDGVNPVVWAYLICGCVLVFISLVFFALFLWKLESRVRHSRGEIVEDREEDSIKGLVYLFILICIYYFFCVAGETSYNSYIYSISICSDLRFLVSTFENILFEKIFSLLLTFILYKYKLALGQTKKLFSHFSEPEFTRRAPSLLEGLCGYW